MRTFRLLTWPFKAKDASSPITIFSRKLFSVNFWTNHREKLSLRGKSVSFNSCLRLITYGWKFKSNLTIRLNVAGVNPKPFLLQLTLGFSSNKWRTRSMFSSVLAVTLRPELNWLRFRLVPCVSYFSIFFSIADIDGGLLSGNCCLNTSLTRR